MPDTPLQRMRDATERARQAQEVARKIGEELRAAADNSPPNPPPTDQP